MSKETVDFGKGMVVEIPEQKLASGTKLYMAGPFGFAESTRPFHQKMVEVVARMGGIPLDPWELTNPSHIERAQKLEKAGYPKEAFNAWQAVNQLIAQNNHAAIGESTGLVAILDGIDVDSGTAAEIGVASVLGRPILGYRGDFRTIGDNPAALVNLQVQWYIERNGGKIFTAIQDFPRELLNMWGEPVRR